MSVVPLQFSCKLKKICILKWFGSFVLFYFAFFFPYLPEETKKKKMGSRAVVAKVCPCISMTTFSICQHTVTESDRGT